MSLTFQLARGGIALAVLALLSLAAWLAPEASPSSQAATRVVLVADAGPGAVVICPLPAPVLRLASAPGDLPARRLASGCRA